MLATYPDACTNKHISGTIADPPTCIHNAHTCKGALHHLGSIAPARKGCNAP